MVFHVARKITLLIFSILFLSSYAVHAAAPSSTILRTIIKDPNDVVLEAASVNFRITYVDPLGTCVMYVEDFSSYNMTGTKGLALLNLGTGTKSYPVAAYNYENVYDNSRSFTCQGGGTYVAASNDVRKVIMQFNDGNGWQTLPAVPVTSVPFSIFAETAQVAKSVAGMPTCVAGQSISFNGSAFTCVAVGTGTVLSVTSGGAPITVGGTATAPTVSIAQASAGVSGYVSSSDWNTFNSKMGNGLVNARIWIGNGSNVATAVQISGDATLDNTGTLTLSNSGVTAGSNYTKFNVDAKGRITSASSLTSADISALGFSTSSSLALQDGLIYVGNAANLATGVVLSGDASIDNTGILTLKTSGVAAGSNYSKFSVDAKGRVTSAGSLTSGDLISILGYAPSQNAVSNVGSGAGNIIISMQSGANGSKPAAGTDGRIYVSTDTQEIYRDNGTIWVKVASVGGSVSGAVVQTITSSGAPISIGGTSSDPSISISQATSSASGFLSAADWSTFNSKLSSITSTDITTALGFSALSNALSSARLWIGSGSNQATAVVLSGDATISNTGVLTLQNAAVTRTNLGLGTAAALNVNGVGNALSTEVVQGNDSRLIDARIPTGSAGGDLSGTYPNPILANSGVSAGTYSKVQVDAKGRVISASNLTSADIAATGFTSSGAASQWTTSGADISYISGNVGIGTSNPMNKLEIKSASKGFDFIPSGASDSYLQMSSSNGAYVIDQGWAGSNTLTFAPPGFSSATLTMGTSRLIMNSASSPTANAIDIRKIGVDNYLALTNSTPGDVFLVNNAGNVGVGTTSVAYKLDVSGDINVTGAFRVNGVAISSGGGSGSVTQVTGTLPISVATSTTTPVISIATATSAATGALSSSDWTTFSNKLSNALNSALIWVGNGSNQATAVALSGDARIDNQGNITLQNAAVTRTNLGLGTAAALNVNGVGNALSTEVVQGNDSRLIDARIPTGAAGGDLSGTYPNPILADSGVVSGANYTKFNVDSKGRVTSAGNITSADVTALGFSVSTASSSQWTTSGTAITYTSGNVGIGTTNPASSLVVSGDVSVTGSLAVTPVITTNGFVSKVGSAMTLNYAPTADVSGFITGQTGGVILNGTGNSMADITGIAGAASNSIGGGRTISSFTGVKGTVTNAASSSSVSSAKGIYGTINAVSHNTIANAYGGYFDIAGSLSDSVTTGYGVYVGTIAGTTNKWSVYSSDSNAPSYFAGSVGIGTTSAAYKLDVSGDINVTGAFRVNGVALSSGGGGGSGTVTQVTGSGPISVATSTTTPSISIAQGTSSADGYLTSSDWTTFNNKLSNALNSALIWVGNGSNQATAVALSGDARIDNLGNITLQNAAVTRGNLGLGTAAALNVNGVGNALSTEVVQGNDSRLIDARIPTGSAGGDLSGTFPNPILADSGVSAGTYSKLQVDAKGRVVSASNLTSADIAATGFSGGSQWTTSGANISYASGNVGIGTTSPDAKLAIAKNNTADELSVGDAWTSNAYNDSTVRFNMGASTDNSVFKIGQDTSNFGQIAWIYGTTTPTRYMTISALNGGSSANSFIAIQPSGGSVGIGTVSPTASLHIVGASGSGSSAAPNVLTAIGGTGGTNAAGGAINMVSGNGNGTGDGGAVTLTSGNGQSAGSINILAGQSSIGGSSTTVLIRGGYYGSTGGGSSISMAAGGSVAGGALTLSSGVEGSSGNISILTPNAPGGLNGVGGAIAISSGNGDGTGSGGAISVTAGNGGATNVNGADVVINPGAKGGAASDGNVVLANLRGKVGVGTLTPANSLSLFQKSGSDGLQLTGVTLGVNGGTGSILTLGYNATGNKQIWIGDTDYTSLSTGFFTRLGNLSGYPYIDTVRGDGGAVGTTYLGTQEGGGKTAIGSSYFDFGTAPSSKLWVNGEVAIGNGYRANAAPANGLIVQGSVGIGTTSAAYKLDVSGDVNVTGAFRVNGVAISSGGGSGSGTVTQVTGLGPISVATSTTTPVISIANATSTATGALTSADWFVFSNKLTSSLTSGQIFIGNGSNAAAGVALSGDARVDSGGNMTLQNSAATRTNLGLGLAAIYNVNLAGDAAVGEVVFGTDTRLTNARTPAGAAGGDLSGTYPSPILANSGVSAGTYTKVTVDVKGRVTSASQITSADITALGFSTSGGGASQWTTSGADIYFSSGKVGIGTTPDSNLGLKVQLAAGGGQNIVSSGGVVDLSLANTHLLKSVGGTAITLSNMVGGATYTIFVSDLTSRTYTFSGCTNTYFSPANAATTFRSTYTISVIVDGGGPDCYVSWQTGFN